MGQFIAYYYYDLLRHAGGLFGALLRDLQDNLVMDEANYSGRVPAALHGGFAGERVRAAHARGGARARRTGADAGEGGGASRSTAGGTRPLGWAISGFCWKE